MITVDIKEAAALFNELIERVIKGEQILITQNNKLIAKLVPFDKSKKGANQQIRVGSAKDLIEISDDFDEPLDDFKNYME